MITNKDISIDSENGKITLNGNKYDLGTQGEIDTAVKDVYSVMGQMGAKNLIIYPYYDPSGRTNRGITYTYDEDGIITANGSTDANDQSYMTLDDFSRGLVLPSNKKYTLTCEKTNDNNKGFALLYFKNADNTAKTVRIHAVYEDGTIRNENSDYVSLLYNNVVHTSVTFWVDTDTIYITQARISTNSGTITNAVLKPMLRLAADTDNTYQPYAMTNKQLTEAIGDLSQTGLTGDSVAAQLDTLNTALGTKQNTLTVTDISSTLTTDPTAVSEAHAFTYGKLLYIYFKLNSGVTDQAVVVTNLPKIKHSTVTTGCVVPAFYMNKEDYNKGCICYITNETTSASVQFRCGLTPTGTGGTVYSAVCLLDD